jgi:tRNA (guanine37-N1)-methyltransferase
LILICGRYEGIDARVKKVFKAENLSVGDYVLTGGEIPAMILIDSISRQMNGVLGNFSSREEERVASSDVYTRPEVLKYKGNVYKVPKVLISGNHKKIAEWREQNAMERTKKRRPDLLES